MNRGLASSLSKADQEAVSYLVPWAARSAQKVAMELAARCGSTGSVSPASLARQAKEVIDLQEQVGRDVLDCLEDACPDWENDLAQQMWDEIGGWR